MELPVFGTCSRDKSVRHLAATSGAVYTPNSVLMENESLRRELTERCASGVASPSCNSPSSRLASGRDDISGFDGESMGCLNGTALGNSHWTHRCGPSGILLGER